MSVIQKIRDKYATLMIVVICVSLVAFLLMDAFVGPKSLFRRNNNVGEINGEAIDYKTFANELQVAESNYRSQAGGNIDDQTREQIQKQVWDKFVSNIILGNEYEKLGIGFSPEEMRDLTVTTDADQQIQSIPDFQDPKTGQFNPNKVVQFLQYLKTQPQASPQRARWMQIEDYLRNSSMQRKFYALVKQAVYYPEWLAKTQKKLNNQTADISYVSVPYTSISDTAINVTDNELQKYIDNNKALFHQEEGRKIEYVSFNAVPTAEDSSKILSQLNASKGQLVKTEPTNLQGFINMNSDVKYEDAYLHPEQIQVSDKDSILSLSKGAMFGPFYNDNLVEYAEMIDKKPVPDTVKVRHILISTQQTPDSTAKRRIDSIETAIKGGTDFRVMVMKYSDDQGSLQTGGEYTLTPQTNFVPEFKDYVFDHKKGDMGVVKTQYGYHLIQILDTKDISMGYKIAYLAKPMDPSQSTLNNSYSEASAFAGKNNSQKAFESEAKTQGMNMRIADDIHKTDYVIPGVGQARELVKWAYGADRGDVSQVFSIGNQYIIAVMLDEKKEGTAPLDNVRPQVEAAVKKRKKAAEIAAKLKKKNTLSAMASTVNQQVQQAQNLTFSAPFVPNAGFEPKVVGAAFNNNLKGGKLSQPIYANTGVFMIKVDSVKTPAKEIVSPDEMQSAEQNIQNTVLSQLYDVMKNQSDIEDNRLKYY